MTSARVLSNGLVSVVLPVFNEAEILRELTRRVTAALVSAEHPWEIIFVDDGSTDETSVVLEELAGCSPEITVVRLSRNFGHQAAVQAGLQQAAGDAVIVMDSDLQDRPEAIPRFLSLWHQGYDVVYAQRFNRKESVWKRFLFFSFYRVLNLIARTPIPQDAGNFGLLDRRVVDTLLSLPETDRYFPGLRSWVGFRQVGLPVEREARYDDRARVSLRGLFRLAKTAIFGFSTFPLTLFAVIAALSAAVCAGSVTFVLWHKLVTGLAVPGWASVIITASFFGSLNALGISVLGEYVIRIYDQVRGRPGHIVDRVIGRRQPPAAEESESHLREHRLLDLMHQIDQALAVERKSARPAAGTIPDMSRDRH